MLLAPAVDLLGALDDLAKIPATKLLVKNEN